MFYITTGTGKESSMLSDICIVRLIISNYTECQLRLNNHYSQPKLLFEYIQHIIVDISLDCPFLIILYLFAVYNVYLVLRLWEHSTTLLCLSLDLRIYMYITKLSFQTNMNISFRLSLTFAWDFVVVLFRPRTQ